MVLLMKVIMMFHSINMKQAVVLLRQFQSSFLCNPRKSDNSNVWDIRTREYTNPSGIPGSGVGRGGGAGGSVRESGGSLGKYGAAQEEGYFHHKQREQLQKIKKQLQSENPDFQNKEK